MSQNYELKICTACRFDHQVQYQPTMVEAVVQYECLLSPVLDQKITLHNVLTLCQFHSIMIMTPESDVEEVGQYSLWLYQYYYGVG